MSFNGYKIQKMPACPICGKPVDEIIINNNPEQVVSWWGPRIWKSDRHIFNTLP